MPHHNSSFSQQVLAEGAAGYLSEQACPQILTATVRDAHAQRQAPPSPNSIGKWRTSSPEKPHSYGESPLYLTSREREVLHLIAEGYPNKQTASLLSISIKTVEKHRQHLMDKLGIHETAGLTRYALYTGII
jgi:DNA-binding NarL/FixJ family response regulator